MTKNCSFVIVWNTKNFRRLKRMWTRSQRWPKKSWLFLARKFKFFDTLSVICEWWRKNFCHILATSWQILHKKFVVYEMMRQAGGKETLSEDDTIASHVFWVARGSSQRWWARYVKIFSTGTQPQGNFAKDPSTLLKSNYVNYSTFSGFWKSDFSCFCSIWPRVSFLMV